jgi:hypothetical protein
MGTEMMTKKDYVVFASMVKKIKLDSKYDQVTIARVKDDLVTIFALDNPLFDKSRFNAAAGYGD